MKSCEFGSFFPWKILYIDWKITFFWLKFGKFFPNKTFRAHLIGFAPKVMIKLALKDKSKHGFKASLLSLISLMCFQIYFYHEDQKHAWGKRKSVGLPLWLKLKWWKQSFHEKELRWMWSFICWKAYNEGSEDEMNCILIAWNLNWRQCR
jgi:hypothetical protein